MKILKKRAIALLIDSFIFGAFYELCRSFLPEGFFKLGTLAYVILFIPFAFKDCVFRNASIGKKIVGICIFTTEWKTPSFLLLAKRTLYMGTWGYSIFLKNKFIDGRIISLFDWEQNVLKTLVIDKKVFNDLKEKVQDLNKNSSDTMLNMYNEYLRTYY